MERGQKNRPTHNPKSKESASNQFELKETKRERERDRERERERKKERRSNAKTTIFFPQLKRGF